MSLLTQIPLATQEENLCNFEHVSSCWNCDNCFGIIMSHFYFVVKQGTDMNDEKQTKDVRNYLQYCEECMLHDCNRVATNEAHPLVFCELEKLSYEYTEAQLQQFINNELKRQTNNMYAIKKQYLHNKPFQTLSPQQVSSSSQATDTSSNNNTSASIQIRTCFLRIPQNTITIEKFIRSFLKLLSLRFPSHVQPFVVERHGLKLSLLEGTADYLEQVVFDLHKRKLLIENNKGVISEEKLDKWRYDHVATAILLRQYVYNQIKHLIVDLDSPNLKWKRHVYPELGIELELPSMWKPVLSVTSDRFEENIGIESLHEAGAVSFSMPIIHATQLAKYSFNNLKEHALMFVQSRLNVRTPNMRIIAEEVIKVPSSTYETLLNCQKSSKLLPPVYKNLVSSKNNRDSSLNDALYSMHIPVNKETNAGVTSSTLEKLANQSVFPNQKHFDGVFLELILNGDEESTSFRTHVYVAIIVVNNRMFALSYNDYISPPPVVSKLMPFHNTSRVPYKIIRLIFESIRVFEAYQPEHQISMCSKMCQMVLPMPQSFTSLKLATHLKGPIPIAPQGNIVMSAISFKEYVPSNVLPLLAVQVRESNEPFVLAPEVAKLKSIFSNEKLVLKNIGETAIVNSYFATRAMTLTSNVSPQPYNLIIATFSTPVQEANQQSNTRKYYLIAMQGAIDFPSHRMFDEIAKECIANLSFNQHPSSLNYFEQRQLRSTIMANRMFYY